jgi:hypothetical protein
VYTDPITAAVAFGMVALGFWLRSHRADAPATVTRVHARTREAEPHIDGPPRTVEVPVDSSAVVRGGWTVSAQGGPSVEHLLAVDLYARLRLGWDDAYVAHRSTVVAGRDRPRRFVRAAREWGTGVGLSADEADAVLERLVGAGIVVRTPGRPIGWRILPPTAAPFGRLGFRVSPPLDRVPDRRA